MQTLTDLQCAEWLEMNQIPPDPYWHGGLGAPAHYGRPEPLYEQVEVPTGRRSASLFGKIIQLSGYGSVLLHCTDWELHSPDEMAIFEAVRRANGEDQWLIKTPGHLFEREESELKLLTGMLSLVTYYAWTGYVYFDNATTLLSWEGELLDIWAYDEDSFAAISEVLRQHNLPSTHPGVQEAHGWGGKREDTRPQDIDRGPAHGRTDSE